MTTNRGPMAVTNGNRRELAAYGENQGLLDWNLATGRTFFSPRWISMMGCSEHQVGNSQDEWFRRVHPDDLPQLKLAVDEHLAGGPSEFENQHRMLHKDGTYRWMAFRGTVSRNEKGKSTRLAGSHADITAEKVADALTGLPNRLVLLDRLTCSVERAKRRNDFLFAVLVVDLDRFELQNERLGPAAGDQLLIAAARRLETCLRAQDAVAGFGRDHVIARFGGDEFTILLDSLNEVGEARITAERLLREISEPFKFGAHEAYITASIGIALSATGYPHAEEVLRDADTAVHRAKTLGRARAEVFDTAILHSAEAQLQLEDDLRRALEQQEFVVHYQPIVSLPSKQIAGFEALVRWNHPSRGLMPPHEFIPIAEQTGLIVPLGQWVLLEACRQLRVWQEDLNTKELWISVNLSGVHFRQPSLAGHIGDSLYGGGLEGGGLILELTETAVMENPEAALATLMQLRVMGARIALDDFGEGYSSMTYLRRLPLDFLKIDRNFILKMGAGRDFVEIVRTMVDLAHQLGLHVIAEGVEEAGQLELIESFGCEYGQGFLFSRPVSAERASVLLKTGAPLLQESPHENFDKEPADRCCGESGAQIATAVPPGHSGSRPEELTVQSKQGISSLRRASLLYGLGALLLISAVGSIGRLLYVSSAGSSGGSMETVIAQTPAPAKDTRTASSAEAAPTRAAPEPSSAPLGKEAAAAGTKKPVQVKFDATDSDAAATVSTQSKNPIPPARQQRPRSFTLVHLHVIGSCKGTLSFTPGGLSYVPEKGKDAFTLTADEYSCSLSGDRLVIKSGSKTYRFKPAASGGQQENEAQLKKIVQAISANHPDARPKAK